MLSETPASALRFTRLFGCFECCRSCGSAEADDLRWRDAASSAPATTARPKGDGSRSPTVVSFPLVSPAIPRVVAAWTRVWRWYVCGTDCWGSVKIRGTFVCADDCSEGACHVGIVHQVVQVAVCQHPYSEALTLAFFQLILAMLSSTSRPRASTQNNVFSQYNVKPTPLAGSLFPIAEAPLSKSA